VQYVRNTLGLQVCAIAKLDDLLAYLSAQGGVGDMATYLPKVQAYRDRYGV
jgi:orotate phosphoribosyltransferase